MNLTKEQLNTILTVALNEFREHHSDITAARILTLITVARNPGVQQAELGNSIPDLSQAAQSRNLLDWSNLTSKRKAGPGFLEARPDPLFRKRNVLFVTPSGKAFLEKVTEAVNARITRKG